MRTKKDLENLNKLVEVKKQENNMKLQNKIIKQTDDYKLAKQTNTNNTITRKANKNYK